MKKPDTVDLDIGMLCCQTLSKDLLRVRMPFMMALALMVLLLGAACDNGKAPGNGEKATVDEQPARGEKRVVHLYFADLENGYLKAEEIRLALPADANVRGRRIIEALIAGPRENLSGTIPAGTTVRAFFVLESGTAYVDLSKEARDNHPGGAKSELMTIFSLVNTLVLNMPDVDAVKILIDGREETTLAGHIDLRYPLTANMLLIR